MSDSLHPIIAAQDTGDGSRIRNLDQDTPEPAPITEQEVGEYREQDRFLPVRWLYLHFPRVLLTFANITPHTHTGR